VNTLRDLGKRHLLGGERLRLGLFPDAAIESGTC
jgi:hypothetical protein